MRELVENPLDSAESISDLPVVETTIEEIGRSKFNSMIGWADHIRRYEARYDDFETAKARKKRLAKEARVLEIQTRNVALGKNVKDPAATKAAKGKEASYYRVTCKDNGRGMPHDHLLFVRVTVVNKVCIETDTWEIWSLCKDGIDLVQDEIQIVIERNWTTYRVCSS
ncbi:hypothetical protein KY290_021219 [Solanum tuberosum]|uniref:Uncharacterized protein n=1 Tax=Solanum tuberosum TaxID=4113 RepID=A0ABQ7V0Z7_SOLTU|nr:hypothetical protein KY285_020144 [Solanum tuberosum]KAH0757726.1 hypothetical protein KY290_021219 [Solanum tuberosum]